jgi:hypothetical protein
MSDNRNENRMPAFSAMADTDITISDLDNIVERESGFNAPAVRQNQSAPQTNGGGQEQQVQQVQRREEDPYERNMKGVLEQTTEGIDENLRPISTEEQRIANRDAAGQYESNVSGQSDDFEHDVYSAAFDVIKELDIIRIPEGFDLSQVSAEMLVQLKEETLAMQQQEAYDYMREEVSHDPYMLELLDYSYQGGMFANLPKMVELLQKEIDWRVVNVNDEKIQREVVKRYYADGLNPANPKDKKLIEFIPARIDALVKDKKLRDEAEAGRQHFLARVDAKKQEEYQRVIQEKQYQEQEAIKAQQQQEMWDREFRNALAAANWSEDKKEAVKKEMAHVRLQNGSSIPVWQYKQEVIFNNPALFQMFLDFTSKFDVKSNSFNETVTEDKLSNSAVNKLVERLQKKNQDTTANHANSVRTNPGGKQTQQVDPASNWF